VLSQQLYSQNRAGNIKIDLKRAEENRVYWSNEVDTPYQFPGGEISWKKYLLTHSRYSEMPEKDRVIGRIFLSFVVEKDGTITDAVITRGLNFRCDKEALRLLNASGKWVAATKKSIKVRSKGNINIRFGIN